MQALWADCVAAAAGGILLGMGFWPRHLAWTGWIALVPLLWAISRKTPGQAFLRGWLYGTTAWMTIIYWMLGPIRYFLKTPLPLALALFTGLCAVHGLAFALVGWLSVRLAPAVQRRLACGAALALALAFVPLGVAADGLYPELFPAVLAYTQRAHLAALQIMECLGTAGIAWLLCAFNAALYAALRCAWEKRRGSRAFDARAWKFLACMAALAALNESYGHVRIAQVEALARRAVRERPLRAALVQGSIGGGKARLGLGPLVVQDELTQEALARAAVDLVIWPESTFGYTLEYDRLRGEALRPRIAGLPLDQFLKSTIPFPVPMLFNARAAAMDEDGAPNVHVRSVRGYNIAFLSGPAHQFLGLVEKRALFPFGEFMPGGDLFPALYRLSPRTLTLSPGAAARLLRTPAGAALGVLICYEDLKPELAREYSRMGAGLLVNMTDDMWFKSIAPEQHMLGSIARAIENRKFVLRAANYGVTAVVGPTGKIERELPVGSRDVLVAEVAALPGQTPYAYLGLSLYYAALALALGLALGLRPANNGHFGSRSFEADVRREEGA